MDLGTTFREKRTFASLTSQAVQKKRHFVYMRALNTRKILRTQRNSVESPYVSNKPYLLVKYFLCFRLACFFKCLR